MPYYGAQGPMNWMPPTNAEFPPAENPIMSKLAGLMRQSQGENDVQRMTQMAAQRLAAYGPQGQYWADAVKRDPRAALVLADEHGGFGAIESRLMAAASAGASQRAWGESLQGSELKPEEMQIMLEAGPIKGPAALKAYREAFEGPDAPKQRERKLPNGMVQREEWVGKQWVPVGEPGVSGGGMSFEVDANGNPVFKTGGAALLARPTTAAIEGKQVDLQDTLARLGEIQSSYRPEFQEWGGKARLKVLQTRSSLGQTLSGEDQRQLSEMAAFRAAAFENMSMVLNQLSGAAISPSEAERLKQFLPDPGTGVFDGDDPITFKRKLDDLDRRIRESITRYAKEKKIGLDEIHTPESASQQAAKPLPPKDQLVEGQVYQTKKGPARWNGAAFSLVK